MDFLVHHYQKQPLCRDARRHGKGVSEHGKGFAVMTSTANPTRHNTRRQRTLPCAFPKQSRQRLCRVPPILDGTINVSEDVRGGSNGDHFFTVCNRPDARHSLNVCRAIQRRRTAKFESVPGVYPCPHGKDPLSRMPASALCRVLAVNTHGILTIWSWQTCQEHRWPPRVRFAVCRWTAQAFAVCL